MDLPPVQYARTSDGYDIAYRVVGSGPPLLFVPPPLIDIDLVWRFFPEWLEGLAGRFRLIQYDMRGQGFSTRNLPRDVSMMDFYRDLETVVERAGFERFLIWAWAMPSHLAVQYANKNPDRVLALVLNTCSISGAPWPSVRLRLLPQEDWNAFLRAILPIGLTADETRHRVRSLRDSMTQEDWDAICQAARSSDVGEKLRHLRVPTLVMHPRGGSIATEESMRFAALVPGAQFLQIDEGYLFGDADQGLTAIDALLEDLRIRAEGSLPGEITRQHDGLSARELEVLRLLAAGRSNPQIAEALVISANTVAKHVTSIFTKTGTANRVEATAYAHRQHLV